MRISCLLLVLLLHAPLEVRAEPPSAQVVVRLFLDAECPWSRQAWPLYRHAASETPLVTLIVQHLPLSRHPLALPAAVAAVAARAQGRELTFLDALWRESVPNAVALERAAAVAGIDLAAWEKARRDPAILAQVQREQQAGLAFGIRSTPSALLNGRGLGGVPPIEALQRAIQLALAAAQRDLADLGPCADLERIGVLRHAPDFLPAFDALREGRALATTQTNPPPRGCLGPRWRVTVVESDLAYGREAALQCVLFLDPTSPWQLSELAKLLELREREAKAGRDDVRVVVKLLLHEARRHWQAGTPPLALWLAAAAQSQPQQAAQLLGVLATGALQRQALPELTAAAGLDAVQLRRLADAPAATAWLEQATDLARRTDAVPGSLFLNGRRWLGQAGDDGLPIALQQLRGERAQPALRGQTYAALVATGRSLREVELDLLPPEALPPLPGLTALGTAGPQVQLFVDFRSPHSRAGFYMLRRLVASADTPIRLTLASIASVAEPGVSASGAAIVAAARLGRGMEMAEWLFSAAKPDDWSTIFAPLRKWGLDQATFQRAVEAAETRATLRAVWSAKQRRDMGDEPVIYLGDRLYQGPLDEARLERAVRFVRDEPSAQPPSTCPTP